MTTWTFTVLLDREPDAAETDALFEAGLDDALLAGATLTVDREAGSLLGAVVEAVEQVRAAGGPRPVGLEEEQPDAVSLADVSARLGGLRTTESLRLLALGRRGPGGFPGPVMDTGKIRVYSWAQVSTWLHDELGDDVPPAPVDLAIANRALQLEIWAADTEHSDHLRRFFR